jgi:MFS family permease
MPLSSTLIFPSFEAVCSLAVAHAMARQILSTAGQGGMVGPIMTFTGLWGAPFLKARFGLDPKAAATISSIMIICWAVASPVFGVFSDKIGKRKPPYLIGSLACAIGWSVMIYATQLPLPVFTAVAALTSFATGCVVVAFAYAKESVPAQHMGAATATTNIGNMLGNVFLQPGIGLLLDRNWTGQIAKGARIYKHGGVSSRVHPDHRMVHPVVYRNCADDRNKLPTKARWPVVANL